jgi:hypothetical protein
MRFIQALVMLSSLDSYGMKSNNERKKQVSINHCDETWYGQQTRGFVEGGWETRGYKVDSWVQPPDLKGHKLKLQEYFHCKYRRPYQRMHLNIGKNIFKEKFGF